MDHKEIGILLCNKSEPSHPPEMQLIMGTSSTPQSSDLDKVYLEVR